MHPDDGASETWHDASEAEAGDARPPAREDTALAVAERVTVVLKDEPRQGGAATALAAPGLGRGKRCDVCMSRRR